MTQRTLFDDVRPTKTKPEPKRFQPNQSPEYARGLKDQILAYIADQGERGACDFEGQEELGIPGDSYRPKRLELENEGLVVKTERTRLSLQNREAHVRVLAKYATPQTPPAKPKPEPAPDRQPEQPTANAPVTLAALPARPNEREERIGPILDSMSPEAVEAVCTEIFPTWPRIAGLGPHAWTPQAARKTAYTRKLLLAAIENSHREQTP